MNHATDAPVTVVDLAVDDERWASAFPVLHELRTHLTPELLAQVHREGHPQGLRFTAVYAGERCMAVAGWRIVATTHVVRKLYVDDLATTASARSRGYGRMLLDELTARARQAGCRVLDLDSGVQRHDAHRFYLRERMDIVSHHFALALE